MRYKRKDSKKGLAKFKAGDFNVLNVKEQPDGSVIIILSKRSEDKVYRFRVRNLYQPDEEVLDIDTGKRIA